MDRAAHLGQSILSPTPNAFSKSAAQSEWVASRYRDVQAVLADERFEVVTFPEGGPVGTIGWLRASVSRFINGAEANESTSCCCWPGGCRWPPWLRTWASPIRTVPPSK